MNRRFLLKFFKYLAIYLSLTIIIAMISIAIFISISLKHFYTSLNTIEPDFFNLDEPIDKPSHYIKDLAKKDNATIYYTDKNGHILYPNKLKHKNIKPIILKILTMLMLFQLIKMKEPISFLFIRIIVMQI